MSRFLGRVVEARKRAKNQDGLPRADWARDSRPFQVLTVASNKGGVGKTTIAANLAVYIRALKKDLPVLILELDDQMLVERMFSLGNERPLSMLGALRARDLRGAINLGRYGVHYVTPSPDISELKRDIWDTSFLLSVLQRTGFEGLVIIDTKSDFEILTRCAIAASDLTAVVVHDLASLIEADRVYAQLKQWNRSPERARIVLSMIDLRIKYVGGANLDVLMTLLSMADERGYSLFESFISRSPKIAGLYTNPESQAIAILHGASKSLVHTQMTQLAREVLATLHSLPRPGRCGHREVPATPHSTRAEVSASELGAA
jgi:chromosome partitioning protein